MSDTRPRRSGPSLPVTAFGRGGPLVSRLALGTMTFGVETDEQGSRRQLDAYVERGGNFIDTADVYGGGESERIIGRWLEGREDADDLVIATKARFAPPPGSRGTSRRAILKTIDGSRRRLKRDAIDVYYIHGWDPHTPVEDTLGALASLVDRGWVHHVAWSNVTGWQLQRILMTARHEGFPVPIALQPQYNLLDRGIELEVLPLCLDEGLALAPWSPLGGGWLTGKYSRDQRPSGESRLGDDPERGLEAYDTRNNDRTFRILDAQASVADRVGRPLTHVAIAWLLGRPAVASVLLGARTLDQLEDNLAAIDLELDADARTTLTRVSAPVLPPYPYGHQQADCGVDVWRRLSCGED